ncbi:MAG: hypothetical protein AAFV49_00455 [Pseudomonadota bacterium]
MPILLGTLAVTAAGVLAFSFVGTDNNPGIQLDQPSRPQGPVNDISEDTSEGAASDGSLSVERDEGVSDDKPAAIEDATATTSEEASEGQGGGVTPGLSALRSFGSPLPPPPSLPGIPSAEAPAAELEVARATPAEPAGSGREELGTASTAIIADFVCPAETSGEPVTLLLPLLSEAASPGSDALDTAAAFGNAANECTNATITVIGYSSAGSNPLEQAVAGLTRAREFVERLNALNVETTAFEVFAATVDETSPTVADGVEIRVE